MEVVPKPPGGEGQGLANSDGPAFEPYELTLSSGRVIKVKPPRNMLKAVLENGIPYPVMKLIQHLEDSHVLFLENLYGKTGMFLFKLEKSFEVSIFLKELALASYYTMANFVVLFLRVYVGPLLPTIYFYQLLKIGTKAKAGRTEEVLSELKQIIATLKVEQLNLLAFVSCHLGRVARWAKYNKMDAKELSYVFAPVFACRQPKIPYCQTKQETEEEAIVAPVVEILISRATEIFKDPFKNPDYENYTLDDLPLMRGDDDDVNDSSQDVESEESQAKHWCSVF